ncbi:MAG: Smr/MutS family protein [Vicingaceae bacterium]
MEIQLGNSVKVIDEELEGKVTKVEDNWVYFSCEDGFEYKYLKEQLIYFDEQSQSHHQTNAVEFFKSSNRETPQGLEYSSRVVLQGKKPVVDLHLETLLEESEQIPKNTALLFQLNHVKEVIQKASTARIRQIVIVHGRGSGTLRDALRRMLDDQFPHIEYFDANYQKFGFGATEIIIHGLGKKGKT